MTDTTEQQNAATIIKMGKRIEQLEKSDAWMEQATEFQESGGCSECFETDEAGHKEGCYIGQLETENNSLKAELKTAKDRIKSEDDIRNEKIKAEFVESDIEYLCMLASYGRHVISGGWFRTYAAKVKMALGKIKQLEAENKKLKD